MNETKHTPGPWEVRLNRHSGLPENVDYLVGDSGSYEINAPDQKYWVAHTLTAENARLVAAAPELLDALRRVVRHTKDDIHSIQMERDVEAAYAAIRKATEAA